MRQPHDIRWQAAEEASELLAEGSVDAAIAELHQQLAGDDENEYLYFFLGQAHFERGEFDKALKAYLKAIDIEPSYTAALCWSGHCLRMLNKHKDALRVALQVLARNTHDQDGLYLAALSYFSLGDKAQTERYLQRFLDTKPEAELVAEARGLLEVVRGNAKRVNDDEID